MSHPSIGGAAMITNIAYVDASSIALMLPVPDAPTVLVPPSGVPLPHGKTGFNHFGSPKTILHLADFMIATESTRHKRCRTHHQRSPAKFHAPGF